MRCVRCGSGTTRRDGQTRLGGQRWRCSWLSAAVHRPLDERLLRALLPGRRDRAGGALVRPLPPELRRRRRVAGRARLRGRSERRLPLGAALPARCSGGGAAAPAAGRQEVAGRRDVLRLPGAARLHLPRHRRGRAGGGRLLLRAAQRRAARAFFERAIAETEVTPERVTTDKAKCYPPALRAVLPGVEHRRSKYLNNGLERDHSHLEAAAASHARLQTGRLGRHAGAWPRADPQPARRLLASDRGLPTNLRLATAWPQLTQAI